MKNIITLIAIVFCNFCFAQTNDLADQKFEEAETAFIKNDYKTTIVKLDEFDKLFGNLTAKSLYLRIVAQDEIFRTAKSYDSETLTSLFKNASAYVNAMKDEKIDDKYKFIEKVQKSIETAKKIDSWEWNTRVKVGMTFDQLKDAGLYKPSHFAKIGEDYYEYIKSENLKDHNWDILEKAGYQLVNKEKILDWYRISIYGTYLQSKDVVFSKIDEIKVKIKKDLGNDAISNEFRTEDYYSVEAKSPYSKYKISVDFGKRNYYKSSVPQMQITINKQLNKKK